MRRPGLIARLWHYSPNCVSNIPGEKSQNYAFSWPVIQPAYQRLNTYCFRLQVGSMIFAQVVLTESRQRSELTNFRRTILCLRGAGNSLGLELRLVNARFKEFAVLFVSIRMPVASEPYEVSFASICHLNFTCNLGSQF